MERYIYINYAYEDYEYVQKIIEDIEKTGVKVYHGNGSEERVAGSLCVLHFWTPAAHTSKSYRKIMNYTLKHELDTMLFHLDGEQMASEVDVQLDVLHALFKYKYQMLSRKAADAETKAAVIKNESKNTETITTAAKEENTAVVEIKTVESKPEVVEAKSVDELKKAMASSEPKVIKFNADSVTESKAAEKESEIVNEKIAEEQPDQSQQSEPAKAVEELTTRDALFAEGMRILENGTTREDGVKAFKCLRQAASQGHTEAQYQLSVCYDRGIGVRRNITEAAKWCQMAAFAVMPRHRVRLVTVMNTDRGLSVISKRLSAGMRWLLPRGILRPRTTWHSAIRRAEAYIRMSKRPFDSMEKPQRAVMPVHSTI